MYEEEDPFTRQLIGYAIEVHRQLGPGLMESTYERAFCLELDEHRVPYAQQLRVPVFYKGHLIGEYRPDLVVDGKAVIEIKSVERVIGVHQAQALAYMRALKIPTGLILNFYSEVLRTGIKRLAI
jgi:GxxExxY protein